MITTDQLGSERLEFSVIKAVRTGAVVVGAVALCLTGTGAASADDTPYVFSEKVPGAWGVMDFGFVSKTKVAPIYLKVEDTAEDGMHARMRVQADTGEGTKSYAWRKAVGDGAVTKATTDLIDTSGVEAVRIQVCRYNGDTQVACTWSNWIDNNHI